MSTTARSVTGAVLALVGLLAVVNVARSTLIPHGAHLALNVGIAAVVVAAATRVTGLDTDELGLAKSTLRPGLRYGGAAFAIVSGATLIAALIPAARSSMDVEDAHIGFGALVLRICVVIPLGTVLVEELVFRGVLHGLFRRVLTPGRAVAAGAVTFGAWHVFPAWRADGPAVALGTFVATVVAGAVFLRLRDASGSLIAPVLAHLATNTVPLTVAWVVVS